MHSIPGSQTTVDHSNLSLDYLRNIKYYMHLYMYFINKANPKIMYICDYHADDMPHNYYDTPNSLVLEKFIGSIYQRF